MWVTVAKIGVSLLVAGVEKWTESLQPTPPPEPPPEQGPIVTAGTSIPVLFGTARIENPPLMWQDVTEQKKSDSPKGTVYGTRAQFLLCYGPVVSIDRIVSETAGLMGTPADVSDLTSYTYRDSNQPWYNLNYSPWTVYTGRASQPSSPLLDALVPDGAGITYRDVAHIVLGEVESGTYRGSPYISARWKYRTDAGLKITFVTASDPSGTASAIMPNGGCNPARIIQALCTSTTYGDGIPIAQLDESSFDRAADLLDDEGWGLTYFERGERGSNALKADVLRHIGGVLDQGNLYLIRSSGTQLYGVPYDDSVTVIDDTKILEVIAYSVENVVDKPNYQTVRYMRRGTWQGMWSEQESFATASDISDPTARTVYAPDLEFLAIPNEELAQKVAKRELDRARARLASMMVQVKVDRSLRIGRRVSVESTALGIPLATYRITAVDHGTPENAITILTLMEDVFTWHENSDGATTPSPKPVSPQPGAGAVFEAPYRMVAGGNSGYVAGVAEKTHTQNDTYRAETPSSESGVISYIDQFAVVEGAPIGVSSLTVTLIGGDINTLSTSVVTFGLWGDEIVRVSRTGAVVRLLRGMLDTVPHNHAPGERLWIIGTATTSSAVVPSCGIVETDGVFDDVRLLPRTADGHALAYDGAEPHPITLEDRWSRPYPPRDVSFASRDEKNGGFVIRFRGNSRENAPVSQIQTSSNPTIAPGDLDSVGVRLWGDVAPGVEGYFGEMAPAVDFTETLPVTGGGYSTITVTKAQEIAFTGLSSPAGSGRLRAEVYTRRYDGMSGFTNSYQAFTARWPA